MKEELAIIGTGIAGLSAAYFLRDKYRITLIEKNEYVGGHTNTISIDELDKAVHFDTGFMVFNHVTYPNLTKLFAELNVPTAPTSMSFSVQHIPANLEYCGSGYNGLFGQRRNLGNPRFWKLLYEINKFNKVSIDLMKTSAGKELSVADFCKEHRLSNDFIFRYLVPMSGAVWSTPPDRMLDFPAMTLIRFFFNHGFLGLNTQHQWYTVNDGSIQYVKRLLDAVKPQVKLNSAVDEVKRENGKVKIQTRKGELLVFDKVIVATHGDQAQKIVKDLNSDESSLLSHFRYQKNTATIHTDVSLMPKRGRIWSSWNYRIDGPSRDYKNTTIYWMNNLQSLNCRKNYFVSIDDPNLIKDKSIIRTIEYEHPLFTLDAIKAQKKLDTLDRDGVYFCGSYHRYGFHEDALSSGIRVANKLLETAWKN